MPDGNSAVIRNICDCIWQSGRSISAVSYTHLDVYKRQVQLRLCRLMLYEYVLVLGGKYNRHLHEKHISNVTGSFWRLSP